jgi:hypothetical protein
MSQQKNCDGGRKQTSEAAAMLIVGVAKGGSAADVPALRPVSGSPLKIV